MANQSISVESLELRLFLSARNPIKGITVVPFHEHVVGAPSSTASPTGLTPNQIRSAYGFDDITFANGAVTGDGAGTTIAIVNAYDNPNIVSDLHQFNLRFGLPDPVLTKVNQTGGSKLPKGNTEWAAEIALDVEWAHAIAPKAKILLVEAKSALLSDLLAAVDYARRVPGVVVVSMSWGAPEFASETSYDSYFTTPAGHTGVTFLAASGDWGAPAGFPAYSSNIVSIGGTSLTVSSSGTYIGETSWSGSGGGISAYEPQPAYQKGVVTQSTTRRTSPDVAYNSDPQTGVPVYNTYGTSKSTPWSQFGGTSAAAPQWAALIAIADQGRALAGLSALDGITQTLPKIYSLPSTDFHDVTTGSSKGNPQYAAKAGYDLVTGRGTPIANRIVSDLIGATTPPPAPTASHFSVSAPGSVVAGAAFSITVSALDASMIVSPAYTGTLHLSSTDAAGVLPSNYTFTTADKGIHTFTGAILKSAGSQTVTAADTLQSSVAGSVSITVTPASASRLVFGQQPTNVLMGAVVSPPVSVKIFDAFNNLLSQDYSDVVTIAMGANSGGAVLGGTLSATTSAGIATFNSLSISRLGDVYTLVASLPGLNSVTSSTFSVTNSSRIIETFESGSTANYSRVGGSSISAGITGFVRHDGFYSLLDVGGADWIYRNDSSAQVSQGTTISVWMTFVNGATGSAAFGFGASSTGTLSVVASPATNQLLLANNSNYGATTIGAATQSWGTNHWYRLEVGWSTTGSIIANVFDSDGTTLLQSVAAATTTIKSGGIAFHADGGTVSWDTVTAAAIVNNPVLTNSVLPGAPQVQSNGYRLPVSASSVSLNAYSETNQSSDALPGGITNMGIDAAFQDFTEIARQLDVKYSGRSFGKMPLTKRSIALSSKSHEIGLLTSIENRYLIARQQRRLQGS